VAQDGDIAEVEAPEELVARVAAIDVAKASGMVWTRGAAPGQAGPARHQGMAGAGHHQRHHRAGRAAGRPRDPTRRGLGPPPTTGGRWCTCWKPAGWWCGWSTPATPEHLPGRPKTDKLDGVWLARLNQRGMLRPSFVPPAQIRQLRDYTRLRSDLTDRRVQRLEQAAGWTP
jgi:transposase